MATSSTSCSREPSEQGRRQIIMSQAPSVGQPPAGSCLRLSGVDWQTYSRLLRAFAERPGVRLTYDRGELEIMSPSLEHDDDGCFLGRLVYVLTEELGRPI